MPNVITEIGETDSWYELHYTVNTRKRVRRSAYLHYLTQFMKRHNITEGYTICYLHAQVIEVAPPQVPTTAQEIQDQLTKLKVKG